MLSKLYRSEWTFVSCAAMVMNAIICGMLILAAKELSSGMGYFPKENMIGLAGGTSAITIFFFGILIPIMGAGSKSVFEIFGQICCSMTSGFLGVCGVLAVASWLL